MPDPLSIATAVVTLLKTSWTVGIELKKFHGGVSTISKTLKDLDNDVESLSTVLASMQGTFATLTAEYGGGDLTAHWENVVKAIENGNDILRELADELQNIGKDTKFLDHSRKQLRLTLAEDKLSGLKVRLHSLRQTLQLSVQVITMGNQVSHQGALMDLCQDIRRIATKINETIDTQHALPHLEQDEAQIASMMTFRECVRSAASIVSSASTAIISRESEGGGDVVMMSDFGDCFPVEYNLAISRWIEAPSVQKEEQDGSVHRPQSAPDMLFVDEGAESSGSDVDLEDEITTALLEEGRQKLAGGYWKDAERILKKCSSRLSNVTWEQRGNYVTKQFSKHAEVLQNLFTLYHRQERWTEAQTTLTQKLTVEDRISRKKDVNHFRDLMALAKISQRRGEAMQALLHARRAWKGFKKLESISDIRSCLGLLIEICDAADVADDGEIYTVMLSRLEMDSSSLVVHTTTQTQITESSLELRSRQKEDQGDRQSLWIADEHEERRAHELSEAVKSGMRQNQSSFRISRRGPQQDNDLLPYNTRSIHAGRRRDSMWSPAMSSNQDAPLQSQHPQEAHDESESEEEPFDDSNEKEVAVLRQIAVSAPTVLRHQSESGVEIENKKDILGLNGQSHSSVELNSTPNDTNEAKPEDSITLWMYSDPYSSQNHPQAPVSSVERDRLDDLAELPSTHGESSSLSVKPKARQEEEQQEHATSTAYLGTNSVSNELDPVVTEYGIRGPSAHDSMSRPAEDHDKLEESQLTAGGEHAQDKENSWTNKLEEPSFWTAHRSHSVVKGVMESDEQGLGITFNGTGKPISPEAMRLATLMPLPAAILPPAPISIPARISLPTAIPLPSATPLAQNEVLQDGRARFGHQSVFDLNVGLPEKQQEDGETPAEHNIKDPLCDTAHEPIGQRSDCLACGPRVWSNSTPPLPEGKADDSVRSGDDLSKTHFHQDDLETFSDSHDWTSLAVASAAGNGRQEQQETDIQFVRGSEELRTLETLMPVPMNSEELSRNTWNAATLDSELDLNIAQPHLSNETDKALPEAAERSEADAESTEFGGGVVQSSGPTSWAARSPKRWAYEWDGVFNENLACLQATVSGQSREASPDVLTAEPVNSDPVRDALNDLNSGKMPAETSQYARSDVPSRKRHFRWSSRSTIESDFTSAPSTNMSALDGSSVYARSDTGNSVSTLLTAPSVSDLTNEQLDQIDEFSVLKDVSVDPPTKTNGPRTATLNERRVQAKGKTSTLSHKPSWTREATEYERLLTGGEATPVPDERSEKLIVDLIPEKSPPASTPVEERETGESEDVSLQEETVARDFAYDLSTTAPRLNAINLAKVSREPSLNVAPRTKKSSAASVAGTETTLSVEDLQKGPQLSPVVLKGRVAHLALIGDGLCGKTSFFQKLQGAPFSDHWDVGFHQVTLPAKMDSQDVQVTVYDAPGQEEHTMITEYASKADCILLCFALDCPTSLENVINEWAPRIPNRAVGRTPVLLVGLKGDLKRTLVFSPKRTGMPRRILTTKECNAAKSKVGAFEYLDCSAKTGKGVNMVMEAAVRAALLRKRRSVFRLFGS